MNLGADHPKAAVVAIDLRRGNVDMAVATTPSPDGGARVIAANARLFGRCCTASIPVIHLVTGYRYADEIRANPFWRTRAADPAATRNNSMRHNQNLYSALQPADWVNVLKAGQVVHEAAAGGTRHDHAVLA